MGLQIVIAIANWYGNSMLVRTAQYMAGVLVINPGYCRMRYNYSIRITCI